MNLKCHMLYQIYTVNQKIHWKGDHSNFIKRLQQEKETRGCR